MEVLAYEEGKPEIVLGRFEDITRRKELENAYIRQARVNQLILEDALAYGEVDLTDDRVKRLHGIWKCLSGCGEECRYTLLTEQLTKKAVKPEEREALQRAFCRETLVEGFETGRDRISLPYMRMSDGGRMGLVRMEGYLYLSPDNGHVGGLFCLWDIKFYVPHIRVRYHVPQSQVRHMQDIIHPLHIVKYKAFAEVSVAHTLFLKSY